MHKLEEILENQKIILRNQDNLAKLLNECQRELLVISKRALMNVDAIRQYTDLPTRQVNLGEGVIQLEHNRLRSIK